MSKWRVRAGAVLLLAAPVCASTTTGAQWVKHRTPDIPHAGDGKPICRRLRRERQRTSPIIDEICLENEKFMLLGTP